MVIFISSFKIRARLWNNSLFTSPLCVLFAGLSSIRDYAANWGRNGNGMKSSAVFAMLGVKGLSIVVIFISIIYKQHVKGFNFPNIVAKNTLFLVRHHLFPLLHRETGYWNRKDMQLTVWQYSNSDWPLCLNCSSIDTQWSVVLFVRSFCSCTVLCIYKRWAVFSKKLV